MKRFNVAAATLLAAALALPVAAQAEDAPGVFKIPGTESTIKFYGYVQLDTTFDMAGRDPNVEGNDWATQIALVPLKDSWEAKNKKNQLYFTARTSRFGLVTSTPSKWGAVSVKLEGDFNAPNLEMGQTYTNSVLFRLRQAYGSVGNLLVGQTWSTFLDFGSAPDTVDFNGPGSLPLIRNPMIRYTAPITDGTTLAVALENAPGTDGNDYCTDAVTCDNTTRKFQTIPDVVAALNYGASWGGLSLRGMTTNYKRADPVLGGSPYSKQGFGGSLGANFKISGDTLVAYVVGGPGIGRYIMNTVANGFVVDDPAAKTLTLVTAYAYHVGYTHVWNPEFRSNLVWSQTMIQNPSVNGVKQFGNTANETMSQIFVNTFWSATKNTEFGAEYIWGERKTFDVGAGSQKGDQSRVNVSFHYNFF
jgi:hypothetical protein